MYKFCLIDDITHDTFLTGHNKEHFMQTSTWGHIKSLGAWKYEIVGLYKDNNLVASTMLLKRKMPIINKLLYYAPRGFIIDFNNKDLLQVFTTKLKEYLENNNCCYMIVDPDIYLIEKDLNNNIISSNNTIVNDMINIGYIHRGYTQGFDGTQPRYTFRLPLRKSNEDLFNNYNKVTRQRINKAKQQGVYAYQSDDIDTFYNIISDTAERDNFIESPKEYYERVYKYLKENNMGRLYHSKYDPNIEYKYTINQIEEYNKELIILNELYTKTQAKKTYDKINNITKQITKLESNLISIKDNINKYPNGIVLSAGITMNTKNRAWTIFGGSLSILKDKNSNYVIKDLEYKEFNEDNFEFVDLFGAIDENDTTNKLYGIHDFKKRFGGNYIEFIGEFNLVINKPMYYLWTKVFIKLHKLYKKLYVKFRLKKD